MSDFEREQGRMGESPGETIARALGNIQGRAEHNGGAVRHVIVLGLIDLPVSDDDPYGAETLAIDWTPGAGYAERLGMLRWALLGEEDD